MKKGTLFTKLVPIAFALLSVIVAFVMISLASDGPNDNVPVVLGIIFFLLVVIMGFNAFARKSRAAGDSESLAARISTNAIGCMTLFLIVAGMGVIAVRGM